jgi:ATP-dependent DNA helicase DinG
MADACSAAAEALDTVSDIAPDFARLLERALEFGERLRHFAGPCQTGSVRWLEVGAQLRLIESPLDIAQAVQAKVLGSNPEAAKTWIFTSATLGDDDKLSWFTKPCGLVGAQLLKVGSPFDYATQAAVYVPRDFPKPSEAAHMTRVAQSAALWAARLGGRTMVLTTTLRALRGIADILRETFDASGELEVLVQGALPKRVLIERFRQGNSNGGAGCILVASASFWEGIDVPGDALQLVIIDKLPFPPPNDPMAEARSKHIESEGRSAFNDYFLPEAAVALKQGAGRLIRRETDQGVLVVCDTRLVAMGYGKRLLKALPPMQRLNTEAELLERLDALTKTCTTPPT